MRYRDSRTRIRRKEGGIKQWIIVRRLQCTHCNTMHTELPDCLTPYKHYETEEISGALDGIVTSDDADSENYPCPETIRHWQAWFQANYKNLEKHLHSANTPSTYPFTDSHNGLSITEPPSLRQFRQQHADWLERLLKIIYNNGDFLDPL